MIMKDCLKSGGLGPRVLAPIGVSQSVSDLLDCLPPSFRTVAEVRVFTPPHTQAVAQQIQAWRTPTNPIDVHSLSHRTSPAPDTDLIITIPRPDDAPRIAARLLSTTIPFALLLPAGLAPRIAADGQFDDQPDLREAYLKGGKMMFLDSDFLVGLSSAFNALLVDNGLKLEFRHATTIHFGIEVL
jgi:hypothetical protein